LEQLCRWSSGGGDAHVSAAKSRERAGYARLPFDTSADARDVLCIALLNTGARMGVMIPLRVLPRAPEALVPRAASCARASCSTRGRAVPFA